MQAQAQIHTRLEQAQPAFDVQGLIPTGSVVNARHVPVIAYTDTPCSSNQSML